jgi:hypothetical protein
MGHKSEVRANFMLSYSWKDLRHYVDTVLFEKNKNIINRLTFFSGILESGADDFENSEEVKTAIFLLLDNHFINYL